MGLSCPGISQNHLQCHVCSSFFAQNHLLLFRSLYHNFIFFEIKYIKCDRGILQPAKLPRHPLVAESKPGGVHMSAKTKIVVLHMKEVIYTVVFLVLALVLGGILFLMFGPGHDKETAAQADGKYQPGVYSTSISLNDNTFDVQVTVDSDRIKSIELVNLSESTTAMFPLMEPALESLASQIYVNQSLDDIQYSEENKYTSMMLLDAIQTALKKAEL